MNWLFFALLGQFLYTTVNFLDKYIVERQVPDYRGMVIFTATLSLASGFVFWITGGFPMLPFRDTALILLPGIFTVFGASLYFVAVSREAASNIIIFLQMTPVFVFILSSVFLGEQLSGVKFVGFVLILGAAIALSLRRGTQKKKFHFSSAFALILGVAFMQSAAIVLFKFVSGSLAFAEIICYESWGVALGGLILYLAVPTIRHAFNTSITHVTRRGLFAIIGNEMIYIIAKTTAFVAIALGPATLVSVVGSTGVFFGIVFGWILTLLAPLTYKEDISRANLLRKSLLASVLFAGIWLVNR